MAVFPSPEYYERKLTVYDYVERKTMHLLQVGGSVDKLVKHYTEFKRI